jgi:hypothetical protein
MPCDEILDLLLLEAVSGLSPAESALVKEALADDPTSASNASRSALPGVDCGLSDDPSRWVARSATPRSLRIPRSWPRRRILAEDRTAVNVSRTMHSPSTALPPEQVVRRDGRCRQVDGALIDIRRRSPKSSRHVDCRMGAGVVG